MRFHSAYRPVPSAMRVVVTGVVGIVLAAGMLVLGAGHAYASEPSVLPVAGSKAGPGPATGNVARPYDQGAPVEQLPQEAVGIEVVEKLGDSVPRDLRFVDADGREVTIGDLLDGNLPVILTFNYSSCPMLCSAQLRALTESMGKIPLTAGMQYRMVTIGLSPHETPQTAADTKARYIETFPEDKRETIAAGWRFLSGEERAIKAMADAVGLRYRYIEETGEYSHPASLIFLSPTGIVTRYYHGISYEPEMLGASIFQAGAGEYGVSVGFLLACFSPGEHKSYARAGERAMRYGATGFVVFMLAAFGLWQWTRTRKARQE